ncbi:MAG: hypothetical protein ACLR0U_01280 [Enterocloster clostridioformis]
MTLPPLTPTIFFSLVNADDYRPPGLDPEALHHRPGKAHEFHPALSPYAYGISSPLNSATLDMDAALGRVGAGCDWSDNLVPALQRNGSGYMKEGFNHEREARLVKKSKYTM